MAMQNRKSKVVLVLPNRDIRNHRLRKSKARRSLPPALALVPSEAIPAERAPEQQFPNLSPQFAGILCDGIENVHRNWLMQQGMPEGYMPSWKDITEENPRLPYDEDAPKTIEELFASLEMREAQPKQRARQTCRRPRRRNKYRGVALKRRAEVSY